MPRDTEPVAPSGSHAESPHSKPRSRRSETPEESTPALTGVNPIIFFDGVCGMCNAFVDFTIPLDRAGIFRFAPLQGETARQRLGADDVQSRASIVLLDEVGAHRRSTAVVRILQRLGGAWKVLGTLLWLVPWPLRDLGYKLVAAMRYRVFGKKDACRLPTPDESARFLP